MNQLQDVCKIGQGASCCKYLVMGTEGFECMKTDVKDKALIDRNWALYEHVAQGDNCEGRDKIEVDA